MDNHFQSLLRGGHRRSFFRIPKGHQRCSSPTACNLREEPVLNGIELGAIRWIMHNEQPDIQFVGKVHEVLLDDPVRTGVGTSSIAQDNQGMRIRVLLLQVFPPDSRDVVADESGRVVADSQRHVADIPCHIVDAVRNHLAVGEGGEVVVKGLERAVGQRLSITLEVPQHLLLLGVNADDGEPYARGLRTNGGNLPELIVPVLYVLHGKVLIEGAFPKAEGIKDLSHEVAGDAASDSREFTHDLGDAQGYPHHILILREPSRMGLDDLHDSLRPLGMAGKISLPSGTRSADTAVAGTFSAKEFPYPFLKSMCACSHHFTNTAVAEPLGLEVGGFRGQEPSSVSFVQRGHIRQIAWRKDFWGRFRYHFKSIAITLKVTKNPPVSLRYITDNQQIKLNFIAPSETLAKEDFHPVLRFDAA